LKEKRVPRIEGAAPRKEGASAAMRKSKRHQIWERRQKAGRSDLGHEGIESAAGLGNADMAPMEQELPSDQSGKGEPRQKTGRPDLGQEGIENAVGLGNAGKAPIGNGNVGKAPNGYGNAGKAPMDQ
jgi:hypothetical protein